LEESRGPRKQRYQKSTGLNKRFAIILSLASAILIVVICTLLYSILSNTDGTNRETAETIDNVANNSQTSNDEANNSEPGNAWNDDNSTAANESSNNVPDSDNDSGSGEPELIVDEPKATSRPAESGNEQAPTATVAPTQKPASTTAPESAPTAVKLPTTYIVQKGDTLSSISEKFYKSKNHVALIAETNKIAFINDMKAGDKLTIPALSSSSGNQQQETRDYSKVSLPASYMVQAQDTLSSISVMFYKSKQYIAYIAEENNLDKNAILKAGSILTIPSLDGYKADDNDNLNTPIEATIEHVVKKGETLYSISQKYYGTNKHAMFIADYNHIVDVDDLKAGTVLKIPNS
jgi:LysM repeat protein